MMRPAGRGTARRWRTNGGRADAGASAIEVAVVAPALLLLIVFAIMAMRAKIASESVDASAHDAARAASIARTRGEANSSAYDAARTTLHLDGLTCRRLQVTVDTSEFGRPAGQEAAVRARVTCVVELSDLAIPGVPGTRTITSTFSSVLDEYGGRS